jgi:hypothetical protein
LAVATWVLVGSISSTDFEGKHRAIASHFTKALNQLTQEIASNPIPAEVAQETVTLEGWEGSGNQILELFQAMTLAD